MEQTARKARFHGYAEADLGVSCVFVLTSVEVRCPCPCPAVSQLALSARLRVACELTACSQILQVLLKLCCNLKEKGLELNKKRKPKTRTRGRK